MGLGSGPRLKETLYINYVEPSLAQVRQYIATKTASAGLASVDASASPVEQPQQPHSATDPNAFSNPFGNGTANAEGASDNQSTYVVNGRASSHNQSQPQAHYPIGHYYTDGQPTSMQPYMGSFDGSYTEDIKPNIDQMNAHNVMTHQQVPHQTPSHPQQQQMTPHQAPSNFMAAFQSPTPQNGFHPSPAHCNMQMHSGPAAWRHFADGMMTNVGDPNYMNSTMNSANALMALQSDKSHGGMDMNAAASVASMGAMHMAPDGQHVQPWPLIYNSEHGQQ